MNIKRVIEEFYMAEDEQGVREAETKTLSIAVTADTASMLKAIAERFGKSVSSFGGEILEDATMEAFMSLIEEDKVRLSEAADSETTEYLAKRGVSESWMNSEGQEVQGRRHWMFMTERFKKEHFGADGDEK